MFVRFRPSCITFFSQDSWHEWVPISRPWNHFKRSILFDPFNPRWLPVKIYSLLASLARLSRSFYLAFLLSVFPPLLLKKQAARDFLFYFLYVSAKSQYTKVHIIQGKVQSLIWLFWYIIKKLKIKFTRHKFVFPVFLPSWLCRDIPAPGGSFPAWVHARLVGPVTRCTYFIRKKTCLMKVNLTNTTWPVNVTIT